MKDDANYMIYLLIQYQNKKVIINTKEGSVWGTAVDDSDEYTFDSRAPGLMETINTLMSSLTTNS